MSVDTKAIIRKGVAIEQIKDAISSKYVEEGVRIHARC